MRKFGRWRRRNLGGFWGKILARNFGEGFGKKRRMKFGAIDAPNFMLLNLEHS